MAETTEITRRWSGFVCPDCRFIFRVARDHDGRGIVCPSCRRMLRTPAEGDVPPPLLGKGRKFVPVSLPESLEKSRANKELPADGEATPVTPTEEKGERQKRRHSPHKEEQPDWETEPAGRGRKNGGSFLGKGIAIACVVLATFGVLLVLINRKAPSAAASHSRHSAPVPKKTEPVVPKKVAEPELPVEVGNDQKQQLIAINTLARQFLDADTVEKVLPLVRDPAKVEPKLRELYPDGKVPAMGLSRPTDTVGMVTGSKVLFSTFVTRDYEEKQIAFFESDGGLKVDWESFVGWSEIPWGKFITERPSKAMLFRVTLTKEEYYNFEYSDDTKWQSFRLVSPDGEYTLYGYARKDSAATEALYTDEVGESRKVTLLLKFQGAGGSKNQVLIEKVASDGWIEGIQEK